MFGTYSGRWIPDSPEIRQNITRTLRFWNPYSDSSPVEGITEAISTFYEEDKKISIYVFGDDFPRGSIEAVCRYVSRINKADRFGNRLVRIHGIGFPTQVGYENGARFAHLMRKLSEQNGGPHSALITFSLNEQILLRFHTQLVLGNQFRESLLNDFQNDLLY